MYVRMDESRRERQALTPRQRHTLNELLALGGERPFSPPGVSEMLHERILQGTKEALTRWTERSLYMTKSQLQMVLECEAKFKVDMERVDRSSMNAPAAVGIVAHRAIQMAYTHPNLNLAEQIKNALVGARSSDERFDAWWVEAGAGSQSDMIMQITSRVVNFMDDWPPLEPAWNPRFEESLSAKVGHLTLSARADLIIGRPRIDMKQSIFLCDLKSGNLKPEHEDEAMFYALVATLRHGVAPWRSLVYSLAAGEYTDPDVTEEKLVNAADRVILGVRNYVDILTEAREVIETPGAHCVRCPLRETCQVAQS